MKAEAYAVLLIGFIAFILLIGVACITAELITEVRKRRKNRQRIYKERTKTNG